MCAQQTDDKTRLDLNSYHVILFTVHRTADVVEVLVPQGASCGGSQEPDNTFNMFSWEMFRKDVAVEETLFVFGVRGVHAHRRTRR